MQAEKTRLLYYSGLIWALQQWLHTEIHVFVCTAQ